MLREFRLPDLGEGLTESEIVNWHVAVGDAVQLNQVIAEVETAKAVVELPSPYAGIVAHLHEQPGTVVEVGSPIVSFEVAPAPGGDTAEGTPGGVLPQAGADSSGPAKREPNLVGYGALPDAAGRPARRRRSARAGSGPAAPVAAAPVAAFPAPAAPGESAPAPAVAPAAPAPVQERPRSTPPVRKLARDLGIDLTRVPGTGPGGLVVRADVVRAASPAAASPAPTQAAPVPAGAEEREERQPVTGIRKHTAAAMVASAFTAPHATVFLTVDVTPTMDLLARLRLQPAFEGIRLSPLTLAARAVCLALGRFPSLNSRWDEQAREIIRYKYVNLGIAAATPRGLMVPNIKEAQDLSLHGLAQALTGLAQTAREGKTAPADLAGGTISISNVGVFGVDAGTPILNPGEAAILALGAVRKQPWEHNGGIALRQVMTLSLSFDHRVVDGEQGAGFLSDVGSVLAEPALALAMA